MSGRVWSEDELDYLCMNANKIPVKEIAKELGRSVASISEKMRKEKLTKSNRWTKQEIAYLKKQNGKMQDKEIAKALGRTASAVRGKCGTMGLRKRYIEWSPEQDELLLECCDSCTYEELAQMVGHPSGSVRQRIRRLTTPPKHVDVFTDEKLFKWFDENAVIIERDIALKMVRRMAKATGKPIEGLEDKYNTWRNNYMHTKFI